MHARSLTLTHSLTHSINHSPKLVTRQRSLDGTKSGWHADSVRVQMRGCYGCALLRQLQCAAKFKTKKPLRLAQPGIPSSTRSRFGPSASVVAHGRTPQLPAAYLGHSIRVLVPQAGSIASVMVDLRPCPVALAHESLVNDLHGATSFLMPYSPSEHTLSLGGVCPFLPLLRQEAGVAAVPVRCGLRHPAVP